eukprot:CAMPEP_0172155826 /NCGR_PEP_ID=MMETSP1050-20130122/2846_1 /TAXON_ID=233186 /ORGANISM="Cryptomonas curvata, Strain CCAP979/52" /LENGTH=297 /DNA_ID=CAMNT_0012824777 /DNA_START=153 /DNA_END=1044 /DNA_ORIENTATION=-
MDAARDTLAEINDKLRSEQPDNADTRWLPLESNPELFTNFGRKLGLPAEWEWTDILGFDSDLLDMVPQPVAAVILLFPCTTSIYAHRKRVGAGASQPDQPPGTFFLKQVPEFGNACGTIACVHALANSQHHFARGRLSDGSPLIGFLEDTAAGSPEQRGRALVSSAVLRGTSDSSAHDAVAQTRCPDRGAHLDHHFAAFVRVPAGDGGGERVVELDGTKPSPVDHGPTRAGTFLADVAAVVQRDFIAFGEGVEGFAMMALSPAGAGPAEGARHRHHGGNLGKGLFVNGRGTTLLYLK